MILARITSASGARKNARVHNPYKLGDCREIIERLRIERGFTSVRSLAIAAGIPQPSLHRYLAGGSETMELASFGALARVLDVTLSELLGEVPISSRKEIHELRRIMDALAEPEREALLAAGRAMVEVTKRPQ
jgi:transcriptional regulator with XRE-family HTH domain